MKVLVVGSGGREHALVYKLSQHHEVLCAPGNPGIGHDVETVAVVAKDTKGIIELCRNRGIDLVVVGPEDLLIDGLADQLRAAGFATFGPDAAAARLEGSKAYSKGLMADANIPTARFKAFTDPSLAGEYARKIYDQGGQLAVKVSGAALGKGVAVCDDVASSLDAINRAMVLKEFGASGEIVVLEERLIGREFSLLTLVGDHNFESLPIAQDYKRALDGDQGPNTGGMGSYSPCDWASADLIEQVERSMVAPILAKLKEDGSPFRGNLFTGVMVTADGPKCLEYNVRFGDPETQSIMMRLEGDFGQLLYQSATGEVVSRPLASSLFATTVIVACTGYPGEYSRNNPISIGTLPPQAKLFFAGVGEMDGALVTTGGRVIAASATGTTPEEAKATAYAAAKEVRFDGAYFRTDIGSYS